MSINIKKKPKGKERILGSLRRTQLITTFGCGSIVDLPYDSVVVAGTDNWKTDDNDQIISEENLQSHLGVDYFVQPRIDTGYGKNLFSKPRDIPAYRFPEMLICPKCQKIAHYKSFGFNRKPVCGVCKTKLIPSRFIIACENGHMDDFPYSWWVHKGDTESCENPDNLKIWYDKQTGGLESIVIKCESCGKVRNMGGSFAKEALSGYRCKGRRPWLNDYDVNTCKETPRTLQRGSSNVYFPVHKAALSVPPWSNIIHREISSSSKWELIKNLVSNESVLRTVVENSKIHRKLNCTVEEVIHQIKLKHEMETTGKAKDYAEILEDEYKQFISGDYDDADFSTNTTTVPGFLAKHVEKIVLVKRLREVLALTGFTRIRPFGESEGEDRFVKLSKTFKKWLPAIELRGEGIFLKLNIERLRVWEEKESIKERYSKMEERMKGSIYKIRNFSPRFVLLHTLSHLIIRQLVLQCGYSSSAIKERIYSTYFDRKAGRDMAGILIYTATPDSEGSLGGLVREGLTDRIENSFRNMLDNAGWCSSDPLCIKSESQGIDGLNYAACHSCTLLSETSCVHRNCYLDRVAVTGDMDDSETGFFADLFEEDGIL